MVGAVKDTKLPKPEAKDDTFAFRLNYDGESQGLKLDMTLDKITSFAMPNLSSVAGTTYEDPILLNPFFFSFFFFFLMSLR